MSKLLKISSLVVGLAMVLSFVAVPASAATVDELMAQIAALTAQIAALKGGSATTATTFTRNLTVGSTGTDVSALQQILIDGGYLDIATPTTYFGAKTKAALVKYQKENGISATGYFGPLTREFVNSAAGTTGGTTTTGTGTVVADGTDGSVTFSSSGYVSTSQTLKKGDVKDVLAVQVKAVTGKVNVNRLDVRFDTYPWLLYSKAVLKDSTGKVLAEKAISGASDVTELTAGTDYLLRFEGLNYTVTPGADATLVVNLTVLPASDKITGQSVHAVIPTGGIRTVNGKGYTDTPSFGGSNTFGATTLTGYGSTLIMSSTGSTGDLSASVSSASPVAQNITVPTTSGTVKSDVTLGVFSLKATNNGGKIVGLSINVNKNVAYDVTTMLQNVRIVVDGSTYSASSLSSGGVAAFSISNGFILTPDVWKDITVKADVLATSTSWTASTSLDISTISGTDANYNTFTYGGGNAISGISAASDPASADLKFVANGMTISGISSTKNVTSNTSGVWVAAYPVLSFTATNNSNNPLFISKNSNSALATSTSAGVAASSTVTSVTVTPGTDSISGDTATGYIVPVNGSRTFSYSFTMDNTNGTTAGKKLSVTQINYGLSGAETGSAVTTGLSNLFVQVP